MAGHSEHHVPWQTLYERSTVWRDNGTLATMVAALQEQFNVTGQLDRVQLGFGRSAVRAGRAADGARKKGDLASNL